MLSQAQFYVNLKISLNIFHINVLRILQKFFFIYRTIVQYVGTSDADTFTVPFIHCTFLLVSYSVHHASDFRYKIHLQDKSKP